MEPKIELQHLIKIYGKQPHVALKLFREGKTRGFILGIRQVSPEVIEAAIAFGSTPWQVLWEAEIPLAMPTILTGVNQGILMALSMSVVTSIIAVPGLGQMVLQGVGRLDVGLAAVGGLGIVLLAIMLDRLTQAISR